MRTTDIRPRKTGYDAPIAEIGEDHLRRAPLARQIYSVAVDGPHDWSVRIGVYGEWGTGKTTVLELVSAFAERDRHIVVWFNPWEHSTKAKLWQGFVLALHEEVEKHLGPLKSADSARRKRALSLVRHLAKSIANSVKTGVGEVTETALELVDGYFSFGPADLAKLRDSLGGRRIIVLIDDLDRTASELVPEILYALREVMDIPGFSFICAFDPQIVGKVLRVRHRGFGDGLRFLEKIIDYPVWLPPATEEGLQALAIADREQYCRFVPVEEIKHSIPLLPQSPRAIRQFIRLLSLLKTQVERHNEEDLRWPVILAATVIRTRYPKLASDLLTDLGFLERIGVHNTFEQDNSASKVEVQIREHIEKTARSAMVSLAEPDKLALQECMRRICDQVNLWLGADAKAICYLASMVEGPAAVTSKEFDVFFKGWMSKKDLPSLEQWILRHTRDQHRFNAEVMHDLTEHALDRLLQKLRDADQAFGLRSDVPHKKDAKLLLHLLELLLLRVGQGGRVVCGNQWVPLQSTYESLLRIADAWGKTHQKFWPQVQNLMLRIIMEWRGDIEALCNLFNPLGHSVLSRLDGKAQEETLRDLRKLLLLRTARATCLRFAEPMFVVNVRSGACSPTNLYQLLINPESALWKEAQGEICRILKTSRQNRIVQENGYAMLEWVNYALVEKPKTDLEKLIQSFAKDTVVFPAIWSAATSKPFADRYLYRLKDLPEKLRKQGVTVQLPTWWKTGLAEIAKQSERK